MKSYSIDRKDAYAAFWVGMKRKHAEKWKGSQLTGSDLERSTLHPTSRGVGEEGEQGYRQRDRGVQKENGRDRVSTPLMSTADDRRFDLDCSLRRRSSDTII